MRKNNTPLMEVDLHNWIHRRWPSHVLKKIGINDPNYRTVLELFLMEKRQPKDERSYFLISVYYEFDGFDFDEDRAYWAVFSVNEKMMCMIVDEGQEASLKNLDEKTLEILKKITGTAGVITLDTYPVESVPMIRISSENGSRGAVVEDVYWRFVIK